MPNDLAEERSVSVTVEQMADRLVEAEIRESRLKRPYAQRIVARRAGLAASAIENFQRGRLKNVDRIAGRIRKVYAGFLERQITALQTELAYARAREPERDFRAVEVAIATGNAALGKDEK